MKNECNFIVTSSRKHQILLLIFWIFPFLLSAFMVWATIFYKPDEWYVVLAWTLGLVFSVWSFYITLSRRAIIMANGAGFEYKWGKRKIRLKWNDIDCFKLYKSNMLKGTTAEVFTTKKPSEIGVVYSDTYNDGNLTKSEQSLMKIEGVHCNLPFDSDFNNKDKLVSSLNNCVRNNKTYF